MSDKDSPSLLAIFGRSLRFRMNDKRQLAGMIALLMLGASVAIYVAGVVASSLTSLAGPLMRAGLVIGALWLAWPQLSRAITRIPQWLGILLVVVLLVGIVRPQFLFVVVPLLVVLWFLGPVLMRRLEVKPAASPAKRPKKRVRETE